MCTKWWQTSTFIKYPEHSWLVCVCTNILMSTEWSIFLETDNTGAHTEWYTVIHRDTSLLFFRGDSLHVHTHARAHTVNADYRHFLWYLCHNPKQYHEAVRTLAKLKPSGLCTPPFSNLFFHVVCQLKLLLQRGQKRHGWIYNAAHCYRHTFENHVEIGDNSL